MPVIWSPEEAATKINEILTQANVAPYLKGIGFTLIALFFLLHLYRALLDGNPKMVVEALLRAGIAGVLVSNYTVFTNAGLDLVSAMAALGAEVQAKLGGFASVQDAQNNLAAALASVMTLDWNKIWQIINNVAQALLFAVGMITVTVLFALFFLIGLAIYNFIVFAAMLVIVAAFMIAPLWFAFATTKFLQGLLWKWIETVLQAALMIFLAQAVMGIVVNQVVVKPINDFAEAIRSAGGGDVNSLAVIMKMPIAAFVGMAVGIMALLNVQRIAQGFVGGVSWVGSAFLGAVALTMGGARLARSVAAGGSPGISPKPGQSAPDKKPPDRPEPSTKPSDATSRTGPVDLNDRVPAPGPYQPDPARPPDLNEIIEGRGSRYEPEPVSSN